MAKIITISLPDKLYEDLKVNEKISPSALFQEALKMELNRLKVEKYGRNFDMAIFGATRLKRQRINKWEALKEKCYKSGEKWVAEIASLEELTWIFEDGNYENIEVPEKVKNLGNYGENWLLSSDTFGAWTSQFVTKENLNQDKENEMYWSFVDGAMAMWERIKNLFEEKTREFA